MTYTVVLKVDGKFRQVRINANDKLSAEFLAVTDNGGIVVDKEKFDEAGTRSLLGDWQ
jgi:hypothetical protein